MDKLLIEELTSLLVEDAPETCKNFARYADELDDILIGSITNNAAKALTDISEHERKLHPVALAFEY